MTSATAVRATATIGVVAGAGYLLAAAATGRILLALEIRYPPLSYLDSRRYVGLF